jgi:hypothetical protein
VIDLIGRVNKCGVISPRFDVGAGEMEQWVNNLLPARQFGHIILTTSYGIMDNNWKYQYDRYNDVYRYIPMAGDTAGICVRTDSIAEPWYSPGGYTRGQVKNLV